METPLLTSSNGSNDDGKGRSPGSNACGSGVSPEPLPSCARDQAISVSHVPSAAHLAQGAMLSRCLSRADGLGADGAEHTCYLSELGETEETAKQRSKLVTAVVLCFIFIIAEVVGGILANSLAIITDAAHLLSDVAAFAISLFALWASTLKATPKHSYGFHRLEILGALVSILLIWMLTGVLIYEASQRLQHGGDVDGRTMTIVAICGVLVNICLVTLLHDHGHGHAHGHSHGHAHGHEHGSGHAHGHGHEHSNGHGSGHPPARGHAHEHDAIDHALTDSDEEEHSHCHDEEEGLVNLKKHARTQDETERQSRNINMRGAFLHAIGDLVQSIGVAIAGIAIWIRPDWKIADPICTYIFSILVLATTLNMLRDITDVLMERTPRGLDAEKVREGLKRIEDVVDVHELHIWSITMGKVLLAVHILTTSDANTDEVLSNAHKYCETAHGISHVTIQVERIDGFRSGHHH
eukprot:jgi/Chlat1/244/Chrsp1S03143